MELTKTEKRVLISLHLQGCTGKMGMLNKKQRLALLQGLVAKGYLDKNGEPTTKGIDACAPKFD